WFAGESLLSEGERQRAEVLWQDVERLAQRTQEPHLLLRSEIIRCELAFLDGRLLEAAEVIERLPARGEELGSPPAAWQMSMLNGPNILQLLGRAEQALGLLQDPAGLERRSDRGPGPTVA